MKKKTVGSFRKMKENREKIVMMTTYDAPTAALAAASGVDILLVGDSLAMTVLGFQNTLALTLEESLHHAKSVRRGAPEAFVIGDMPFLTFQTGERDSLLNAGRYLQEAGCNAVKLEGGAETAAIVARMVDCGIPVVGHIGLMPQRLLTSGGYHVVGRNEEAAERVMADAKALEAAGAFMVVLECVPAALATEVTAALKIPTIGIGAGVGTDGQVQVVHDLLGLFGDFLPRHAKRYVNLGEQMSTAFKQYVQEVKNGTFPGPENSF
ncbi:3-methyl-2-oxobutanoate hydroxymethyltransferase [Victivallis sp. Marseille-Q1083]|uniref:3-methyl-2-oxobutanoate hydroxymethyltransferase n=1 Tax=Victivallis sp. Marseille-Q1083 TaxID=2717288 RepID=UPI00158B4B6E|nr:3-methyl-2-oxobutanoate hydroxymethyltransferase [Victivallis sp. Marseille-Q1083]